MTLTIAQFDSLLGVSHKAAVAEVTNVTMVAQASLADANYFTFADGADNPFYLWFDVSGTAVDPAPGGTGIEATITADTTAEEVAITVAAAIDANGAFGAVANGAVVTITNAVSGQATDAADFDAGVTVSVVTKGRGADERFVVPTADLQADGSFDAEGDHFGYVWETLGGGAVRITGMAFEKDGATDVVLVVGDVDLLTPTLGAVTNAYIPV